MALQDNDDRDFIECPPEEEADVEVLSNHPQLDDFQMEYHPSSGRPSVVEHFEDYGHERSNPHSSTPPSTQPWQPFQSLLDFETAELILEAGLNKNQTNRLLSLIARCMKGEEKFTIKNEKQLSKYWELASSKCVKVFVPIPWYDVTIIDHYMFCCHGSSKRDPL